MGPYSLMVTTRKLLRDGVLPDKPFRAQPTWILYILTLPLGKLMRDGVFPDKPLRA